MHGVWCRRVDLPYVLTMALCLAVGWQWWLRWGRATPESLESSGGRSAPHLCDETHDSNHCRKNTRTDFMTFASGRHIYQKRHPVEQSRVLRISLPKLSNVESQKSQRICDAWETHGADNPSLIQNNVGAAACQQISHFRRMWSPPSDVHKLPQHQELIGLLSC